MPLTRRSFLSSTTAVLLPFGARAEAPASSDGFRILTAGKTELALMPPPSPKTAACGFAAKVPGPLAAL